VGATWSFEATDMAGTAMVRGCVTVPRASRPCLRHRFTQHRNCDRSTHLFVTFVSSFLREMPLILVFVTFGLFLLVINAAMIMLAAKLVTGFVVYGWVPALEAAGALAILGILIRAVMKDE